VVILINRVFIRFDLHDRRDVFERPQLVHLNTVIVINLGFSVFWWWLCNEVLLYFERPLEKFERPFLFLKTSKKTLPVNIICFLTKTACDI